MIKTKIKRIGLAIAAFAMLLGAGAAIQQSAQQVLAYPAPGVRYPIAKFANGQRQDYWFTNQALFKVKSHAPILLFKKGSDIYGAQPKTMPANAPQQYTSLMVLSKGQTYFGINSKAVNGYVNTKDTKLIPIGTVHVNYNRHYGIQIWTMDHKVVKNHNGSAKKLAGQTNWKVYGEAYLNTTSVNNPHRYFNLGGDQYIDWSYVSFRPTKAYKAASDGDY